MVRRFIILSVLTYLFSLGISCAKTSTSKITTVEKTIKENEKVLSLKKSMLGIYRINRLKQRNILITKDFVLHGFSLYKREVLREFEKKIFYPLLKDYIKNFTIEYLKTFKDKKDRIPEAIAYLYILNNFSGNNVEELNKEIERKNVKRLIDKELKNLKEGKVSTSSIFGVKIDYSLFKTDGLYREDKDLKNFYLTYRYATYMPFLLFADTNTVPSLTDYRKNQLAKMYIQFFITYKNSKDLQKKYKRIINYNKKLYGNTDDIGLEDIKILELSDYKNVKNNIKEIKEYLNSGNDYPIPKVIPFNYVVDKNFNLKNLVQFKFIPMPYGLDSYIFQNLTYPFVKEYLGNHKKNGKLPFTAVRTNAGIVRGFPLIGDIAVVIHPSKAENYIKEDKNYKNYTENVKKLHKEIIKQITGEDALYAQDFDIYIVLLNSDDRNIKLFKSYYIENRYTFRLFTKQSTTGNPKGLSDNKMDIYIEKGISKFINYLRDEVYFIDSNLYKSEKNKKMLKILKRLDRIVKLSEGSIIKRDSISYSDYTFLLKLDRNFNKLLDNQKDKPIFVSIHYNPNAKNYLIVGVCYSEVEKTVNNKKFYGGRYKVIQKKMKYKPKDSKWKEICK